LEGCPVMDRTTRNGEAAMKTNHAPIKVMARVTAAARR